MTEATTEKADYSRDLVQVPVDALLSVMCGCSVVVWLTQPSKLRQDFVTAPLLPGRSLIHQYMCSGFVDEYRRFDWDAGVDNDAVLQTFRDFVENCEIRSTIEEHRKIQNDPDPDVIPYPGIRGAPW